jgi:hypothetical protein
MLKAERVLTVDLAATRAQAKGVALAISRERGQHPTFTSACKNMAAAAAIQDTLPRSFADGLGRLYCWLGEILTITAAQQVEYTNWRRARDST